MPPPHTRRRGHARRRTKGSSHWVSSSSKNTGSYIFATSCGGYVVCVMVVVVITVDPAPELLPCTWAVQTWGTQHMLESSRFSRVMDTVGGGERRATHSASN